MATAKQIAALKKQIADLQSALGTAQPAEAKPQTAPPWKKAGAATKTAAHNAGKQAQVRHKAGSKAGVTSYKKAYDASLVGAGFRGKYVERDARRATATARKAA